jgi:hypothetical protein
MKFSQIKIIQREVQSNKQFMNFLYTRIKILKEMRKRDQVPEEFHVISINSSPL